ncbi:HNH endonuclease signature motif containing protein [Branchiibius sp. NY16-3462-2]|uniref:HNH endonuclease signature motif containing protein n=1 Tax=Branchiibius sp. NY16-3462-2 TaxID=1807500 RepID=UPI000792E4F2|nr:HNH endonuclease signature motif containing protein [Branchiibius sp. NY16-3462-2]KYH45804.1 hypothetical protein AZH51_08935 [Branchiibius sp. NY16-3462-2]
MSSTTDEAGASVVGAVDGAGAHSVIIGRLHSVLDEFAALSDADLDDVGDGGVRAASRSLAQAKARIDAVLMVLARTLDERGTARAAGATSTGALLAGDFGGDRPAAARMVRTARRLTNAPVTHSALGAGALGGEQAGIIAAALTRLPVGMDAGARRGLEDWLIAQAKVLSIQDLARAAMRSAAAFKTRADADVHEDQQLAAREQRARAQSAFWMADNRDGTWRGGFTVPEAAAEALKAAVEAGAAPRRTKPGQADRATDDLVTEDAPGTDGDLPMDRRHREGRAFAAICGRLPADQLPNAGGMSAVLTVNVDFDAVTGQLGPGTLPSGARVSAAFVREAACSAGIIPQVMGGGSLPLDLGRLKRLFTATQRRALAQRDRGCVFPGCDRTAAWTEGHHWRDPWTPTRPGERPGNTDLDNGCLLCAEHHRLVHKRQIPVRERGGYLEFLIPPLRPLQIYDSDLLTGPDPEDDGDPSVLVGAAGAGGISANGLQWQRNQRWRA